MAFRDKECEQLASMLVTNGANYRYDELVRFLEKAGFSQPRPGKGSHRSWRHPGREHPLMVKDDGSRKLKAWYVRDVAQAIFDLGFCSGHAPNHEPTL